MAHTIQFFSEGIKKILAGEIDLEDDTIKVALIGAGYSPDLDAHEFMDEGGGDDPIDEEANAGNGNTNGYYAGHGNTGRKSLASKALSVNVDGSVKYDADDLTWTALAAGAGDIYYGLIHKEGTADDTTAPLIALITFDPIFSPDGNDFNVQWNTDGIATAARA